MDFIPSLLEGDLLGEQLLYRVLFFQNSKGLQFPKSLQLGIQVVWLSDSQHVTGGSRDEVDHGLLTAGPERTHPR